MPSALSAGERLSAVFSQRAGIVQGVCVFLALKNPLLFSGKDDVTSQAQTASHELQRRSQGACQARDWRLARFAAFHLQPSFPSGCFSLGRQLCSRSGFSAAPTLLRLQGDWQAGLFPSGCSVVTRPRLLKRSHVLPLLTRPCAVRYSLC